MRNITLLLTTLFCIILPFPNVAICKEKNNICIVSIHQGYRSGYAGGEEDRSMGYNNNPNEHFSLPIVQASLLILKNRLIEKNILITSDDIKSFNECIKKGFIEGYKDGYHGKPMKSLN